MLYRDALVSTDPFADGTDDITDCFLRKNRPHGKTGQFQLRFDPELSRYLSLEDRQCDVLDELTL